MYEYHFANINDDAGTFTHTGTTFDFLELCCQISEIYSPEVCGKFIEALMIDKERELMFLRVVDWNFEGRFIQPESKPAIIRVKKELP